MFCSEWALVKLQTKTVEVLPLRCRCWSCDECRPIRAARLVHEAKAGKPNMFITLTTKRTPTGCPHAAARDLAHAWRKVRREYIAKHGKGSLAFLVVFEATKRGWPHLHMVARCKWIGQKWLSKRMKELIGAPHVDVRRIKGLNKVAEYVTKYIGKNPHRFEGTKRYWRSQDYLFPPADSDETPTYVSDHWQIVKADWLRVIDGFMNGGYTLEMTTRRAVLTRCAPT